MLEQEIQGIKKPLKLAEEYWSTLGPGLVTGAADDDPSGIATYSQAGASYGYGMLWLALFTFPFMAMVQEMCARIGLATGSGLAANIRRHYAKRVLVVVTLLLFIANVINIGADLGAMAASVRLLYPSVPVVVALLVFALVSLLLQIFTTYATYAKYLKYLALALVSYVITAFAVHVDWRNAAVHTLIPSFSSSRDYLMLLCGVLGTTISPYLFFWQTSQEVEEKILDGERTVRERKEFVSPRDVRRMRIDVWSGMLFSNLVMFFIILVGAVTLHGGATHTIETAADAARALLPLAGEWAFAVFAVGIVGTGLLAIPILAGSASYAISESFGWRHGLYYKLHQAYAFYGVIIAAMGIGLLISFLHVNPIRALLFSALINGLIAPVMLYLIVRISSDKAIMGEHTNRPLPTVLGWVVTGVMAIVGIAALLGLVL